MIKPSVLLFVSRVNSRTWRRDTNLPGRRAMALTWLTACQITGGLPRVVCAVKGVV